MPIDQTGTAPGLTPSVEEAPKLNMRCKAQGCNSMQVTEMKVPGIPAGTRLYQCCKCHRVTSVAVGGAFEL